MPIKIFIATPMYGGMCYAHYTTGLLDTAMKLSNKGNKMFFLSLGNESLITRARNELVRVFLETDADYFMFIDADIGFNGDHVLKLIDADKDVICGLYPKKHIDWNRINTAASMGLTELQNYAASYVVDTVEITSENENAIGPIVEIKHGGTGFMLIKRRVFDILSPHVKQYRIATIKDSNGEMPPLTKEFFTLDIIGDDNYLLSEDYFFCNLWRSHGGKIFADLSIDLNHTGTYEYRGNIMIGGSNPCPLNVKKGIADVVFEQTSR